MESDTPRSSSSPSDQKQTIFKFDFEDHPIPIYILALIDAQKALQITAVRFKTLSPDEMSFEESLELIETVGTQTYFSDRNLPAKLFQMKSILKVFDYFMNEKDKEIIFSTKVKNGVSQMILSPKVPVTKNISDHVPFELDIIDEKYLAAYAISKQKILEVIFQAMRTDEKQRIQKQKELEEKLLKQRQEEEERIRKEKQEEEMRNMKEKQEKEKILQELLKEQEKFQQIQSNYVIDDINDDKSEGEIEWSQTPNITQKQGDGQTQQPIVLETEQQFSNILFEKVSPRKVRYFQYEQTDDWEDKKETDGKDLSQSEESVEDEELLKEEYIALLEEKNQTLLHRVVELQTLLIKKTHRLQVYQDMESDLPEWQDSPPQKYRVSSQQQKKTKQLCAILERKYGGQIEKNVQLTQNLRVHFQIFKNEINPDNLKKKHENMISQSAEAIFNKRKVLEVMNKISDIFENI